MNRSIARDLGAVVRQFAGDAPEWSDERARTARAVDGQPGPDVHLARRYRSLRGLEGTCGLPEPSALEAIGDAAEALVSDLTQRRRAPSAAAQLASREAVGAS